MNREAWRVALAACAGSRAWLFLAVFLSLTLVPLQLHRGQWQAFPDALWIDGWARWDSAWYGTIWIEGYRYVPGQPSNVNFFPLYAWICGLLSEPLGPSLGPVRAFHVAGIVVSNLSLVVAAVGLYRLARQRLSPEGGQRAVWLLAVHPFALFLSAVYSEALFLALAVWAFHLAGRQRWWAACALACLAGMTRIVGLSVALGLFVQFLFDPAARRQWRTILPAFLLAGAGTLFVLGLYWYRFGDPLVFVKTQTEVWGRKVGIELVLDAARFVLFGPATAERFVMGAYFLVAILTLVAGISAARHWSVALGVFTLVPLAMAASGGMLGMGRYCSVLFPIYLEGARVLRRRAVFVTVCVLSLALQTAFAILFARWGPVH